MKKEPKKFRMTPTQRLKTQISMLEERLRIAHNEIDGREEKIKELDNRLKTIFKLLIKINRILENLTARKQHKQLNPLVQILVSVLRDYCKDAIDASRNAEVHKRTMAMAQDTERAVFFGQDKID